MAYDGTSYHGFQIQAEHPTIQGELERAMHTLTQGFVRVHGAGRTDAGVHAQGQVISFQAPWRHSVEELERALNAVLPKDICARDLAQVPEGFHARFSAERREYRYRMYVASVRVPTWDRYAVHLQEGLDREALDEATGMLVREADFAAFGQSPSGRGTVRRIWGAHWDVMAESWWGDFPEAVFVFQVTANGFLRGMVRRIVGTLIDVGAGRITPEGFGQILTSGDISQASAPAPACGLFFWRAEYPVGTG